MRKNTILDRSGDNTTKVLQRSQMPSIAATSDLQEVMTHSIANRMHRTSKLDVLEYQPCPQDRTLPLTGGWHLLFFARTGTPHIHDLRLALQQESGRDVQLLGYVQRVKALYREHMAHYTQAHWESVAAQEVLAEIHYGSMSLIPGFWLPEEMEMGLSLLPKTGAQLATDALTLVEHCRPGTSQSLDVLLVTAPSPQTKAELAALQYVPGDRLDLEKHIFTLSTPAIVATFVAATFAVGDGATAVVAGAVVATVIGHKPTPPPFEDLLAKQVHDIGPNASVSQLLEVRQQLLAGKASKA
jgi:hypothetical protein